MVAKFILKWHFSKQTVYKWFFFFKIFQLFWGWAEFYLRNFHLMPRLNSKITNLYIIASYATFLLSNYFFAFFMSSINIINTNFSRHTNYFINLLNSLCGKWNLMFSWLKIIPFRLCDKHALAKYNTRYKLIKKLVCLSLFL